MWLCVPFVTVCRQELGLYESRHAAMMKHVSAQSTGHIILIAAFPVKVMLLAWYGSGSGGGGGGGTKKPSSSYSALRLLVSLRAVCYLASALIHGFTL